MSKLNLGAVGGEYPEAVERVMIDVVYDLDIIRPKFEDFKREAVRIATDAKALEVKNDETLNLAVMLGGNAKKIAAKIETQREAIIAEPREFINGVNGLCNMITDLLVIKKNSKKEITNPDCAENLLKSKYLQHQTRVEMERLEREQKAKEAADELRRKLQAEADEINRKAAEAARKRADEESRIKREKEETEARERGAKKAELEALAKKAEQERFEAIRKAEEEAAKNAIVAPTVIDPVVQETANITRTETGSAAFSKKPWIFEIKNESAVPREYLSVDEKKIRDAIRMGIREILGVRIYQETQVNLRG